MQFEQWLAECRGIVAKKLSCDETAGRMMALDMSDYRSYFDRGLTPSEALEAKFMSWCD